MLTLSFYLLKLFAEGTLTATLVQVLASAALQDGWGQDDETASKLAAIGTSGRHPSNCLRDLLRISKRTGMMGSTPEPYHVEVPGPQNTMRTVAVVLPHEQLQLLVAKDGVDKLALNDADWSSDVGLGLLLRQWGERVGVPDVRKTVAIGIHADGVSYSTSNRAGYNRSVAVSSWNAVSGGSAADRGRRNLFFALGKHNLCDCGCEGGVIQSSCVKVVCHVLFGYLGSPYTSEHKRLVVAGNNLT